MLDAILLTLKLATLTTIILLLLGTPLAWWLARSRGLFKDIIATLVSMPLVLPPTVLGFYLLITLGPDSPLGQLLSSLFGGPLTFTFGGLVIGSVIFSLPFMVQPLRNTFESIGTRPLEVAATLRASPLDTFFSVVLPLSRHGLLTGSIMTFVHTLGEFGVVLMIGGNIPGETKVLSIAIYDYVESLEWAQAHLIAGGMLCFSFIVILAMTLLERNSRKGREL
ncbi:molybdate ABC transporter permease subunit [Neptunomonas qingdaonensis]|uniref:Molybdenum transport system permease n=1 Tax=Neptunomonas qingdaonensis TaxID=1045558 RepID=A0A1I2M9P4_9GAMM|nr:molybdate ABC transporter permease subunit [Neptunomonas qingdaonensis]SFF88224.1 molybdate transport system permease protein [Neptunomonas qingdaonensis]